MPVTSKTNEPDPHLVQADPSFARTLQVGDVLTKEKGDGPHSFLLKTVVNSLGPFGAVIEKKNVLSDEVSNEDSHLKHLLATTKKQLANAKDITFESADDIYRYLRSLEVRS